MFFFLEGGGEAGNDGGEMTVVEEGVEIERLLFGLFSH